MPTDPSPFLKFVSDLGGWGALVLFFAAALYLAYRGGSAFMELARSFASDVVKALESIRMEMSAHNQRLEDLDERAHSVDAKLAVLNEKFDRHTSELAVLNRRTP